MIRILASFLLSLFIGSASAANVCGIDVTCNILAQTSSSAPTVLVNTTWDATGFGGGHTTYCCASVIVPAVRSHTMMLMHGGGGDEFDVLRQFQYATKSTVNYTITNAVWSSTYNGSTVFTISTDPTAGTYGPIITPGNVFGTIGITSTGGSGAGFNSGLQVPFTVIGVHGGTPPYTVTVAQSAVSSPGTYVSGGTGVALTLTPSSVVNAYTNLYGGWVIAAAQGLPPLGGTDNANTAIFSGTLSNFLLTAGTPSQGVIAVSQILSGTGITGSPTVAGHGTGAGWAGTYTYTPSTNAGPTTVTANGCPVAANNETWSNWNSTSCRDDVTALDALAKALNAVYGHKPDCLGHSEGSGMCWREAWENPADFHAIGNVSMPISLYYDAAGGGHTTLPGTILPEWSLNGAKDAVVCVDVVDNAGCNGTANSAHVTISNGSGGSGTQLVAQSVDSGALTPGNWITSGALDGTWITACSDGTHCTVNRSQLVASSTAITMNNSYSANIFNNSNNQSAANLQFPLPTEWVNYVNSLARWANAFCAAGYGSQLPVASLVGVPATVGYLRTLSSCSGNVLFSELSDAGHDMPSITGDLGGTPPGPRFQSWSSGR